MGRLSAYRGTHLYYRYETGELCFKPVTYLTTHSHRKDALDFYTRSYQDGVKRNVAPDDVYYGRRDETLAKRAQLREELFLKASLTASSNSK